MSYPAAPWLVYPLLGLLLGRWYRRVDLRSASPRNAWFAGGLVCICVLRSVSAALAARGAVFFRWSTVSAGYFVLSLAVLFAAGLLSMALSLLSPRLAGALSLRGVVSFAVVPVHYAVLEAVAAGTVLPMTPWIYAFCTAVIVAASFVASSQFGRTASAVLAATHRSVSIRALAAVLGVSVLATAGFATRNPGLAFVFMVMGQLSVAGLLGLRASRPTTQREPTRCRDATAPGRPGP